jgi:hypothetical protein
MATSCISSAAQFDLIRLSTVTASGVDGDLVSAFTVSIDSAASRVRTEVKVTRAKKIVVEQKSSIAIR